MSGGRVVTLSPSLSSVTVDPATIANDDTELADITVRLVNTDGNPMPAVPTARFSTSGVGSGTFAWVGSVTDANGEIAATFKTAAGGVYAIAISFNGAVVGVADIFAGSSGSGSVSAFTDISRDAANTAGGTLVTLTVADATGTPTVLFGGASATDVTVVNATTITCRTPATSAGIVGVSCAGVPLTNPRAAKIGGAFEILPVATTTFFNRDFNDGVVGTGLEVAVGSTVEVQTTTKYSGTHALRTYRGTTGSSFVRNTPNVDIASEANGVYVRYYQFIPSSTASTWGDQIKTHLFRRQAGSGQPGWIMTGIGPDFPDGGSGNTLVSFLDNGIVTIGGAGNPDGRSGVGINQWNEWVFWQSWNAGTSQGRCKAWLNGKLQYDVSSSVAGSANTDYRVYLGVAYVQNPTGTVEVFIDDAFMGNGFPAPVEV
jgi:hypothetical protein